LDALPSGLDLSELNALFGNSCWQIGQRFVDRLQIRQAVSRWKTPPTFTNAKRLTLRVRSHFSQRCVSIKSSLTSSESLRALSAGYSDAGRGPLPYLTADNPAHAALSKPIFLG